MNLIRKLVAEGIGTFAMLFCGTGAIIINQESAGVITHLGIAITFGLIVAAMIYALGAVSGAHLNPVVTVAFCLAKRFPLQEVIPYLLAQLMGALLASTALHFLFPNNEFLGATMPAGSETQSFILEVIVTYLLVFTIFQVAHGSKEQGLVAGTAIGSYVLLAALFAGPISGASMNPVSSLAPALVSGHLVNVWIYLVAPFIGAFLAVATWTFLNPSKPENKQ
jgi:aquaporin Z